MDCQYFLQANYFHLLKVGDLIICAFFALAMILWYVLLSESLLIFVSTKKFFLVFKPFENIHKGNSFTLRWIFVIFGFTFSLSLFLTLVLVVNYNILPTALCLPFFDPTHSILILKILVIFVVISQTSSTALIVIMFWLLLAKIQKSTRHLGMKKDKQKAIC